MPVPCRPRSNRLSNCSPVSHDCGHSDRCDPSIGPRAWRTSRKKSNATLCHRNLGEKVASHMRGVMGWPTGSTYPTATPWPTLPSPFMRLSRAACSGSSRAIPITVEDGVATLGSTMWLLRDRRAARGRQAGCRMSRGAGHVQRNPRIVDLCQSGGCRDAHDDPVRAQ